MTAAQSGGRRVGWLVLAALLMAGCTETRTVMLAPASAELLAPGTPVDVSAAMVVAQRHGHVAGGAGEGALAGFVQGASAGAGAPVTYYPPQGRVYTGYGSPLGALAVGIVGGIIGAATARPEVETRAAEAAILGVYGDRELLDGIDRAVEREILRAGSRAPVLCPEAHGSAAPPAACIEAKAPRPLLRFDTAYRFATLGSLDPTLVWAMEVNLAAGLPGAPAERLRWIYRAPGLHYFSATANGAAGLRGAIAQGQAQMARRIVADLVTERNAAPVVGTYRKGASGVSFFPDAVPVGVAMRLPPEEQLYGLDLGPDAGTPAMLGTRPGGLVTPAAQPVRIAPAPAPVAPDPAPVAAPVEQVVAADGSVTVRVELLWSRDSWTSCGTFSDLGPVALVPGGPAVRRETENNGVRIPFEISATGTPGAMSVVLTPLSGTFGRDRAVLTAGAGHVSTHISPSHERACGHLVARATRV